MTSNVRIAPLISVIIPVFNTEKYLSRCIESILAQTYPSWECLLIDDGSRDGSFRVMEHAAQSDGRIRIFKQEHKGVSAARNVGLSNARGDYIIFLDSDDAFAPNALEMHIITRSSDACRLSISNIRYISEKDSFPPYSGALEDFFYPSVHEFADTYLKKGLLLYSGSNKLYDRSVLTKNEIRFREDLHFGEDRLFNYDYLRAIPEGGIVTISECLLHYYMEHDGSLTNRYVPRLLSTLLLLHHEKLAWMMCSVTDHRVLKRFRYNDWNYELHNWIKAFREHAPRLSADQLRDAYGELYGFRISPAFFFYSMGEKYADVPKMLLVRSLHSYRAFRWFISKRK